jgi:hypothetical protein
MVNDTCSFEFNLAPKFGFCNDVRLDNCPMKKIIWLVPHVIKHKGDVELITWRCNWGNVCKSGCVYALAKIGNEENKITEGILLKTI